MKHGIVTATALFAGLATGMGISAAMAQGPAAPATSPAPGAAAPAPVAPVAVPAKIALIEYEQVAAATNEGQRALADLQTKYDPKRKQLQAQSEEVDNLKKQLQAAPATISDDERASRMRTIDTKEKALQRDSDDASQQYNGDLQEALGKVARKLGPTVVKYVQDNGFTMLLNNTGQQGGMEILWTLPGTDISQAVVEAYNKTSGVAAPMPAAPTPSASARPQAPKPAATN
jgi:outer membrane protein